MITGVSHVTIFVNDQDKALDFYTKKLGFVVNTDAEFGDMRWLTISPANNKGVELVLFKAQGPTQELVGKQAGGLSICSFNVDDCFKTYEEMKKNGVEFTQEPKVEPWGTGAVFKDLYGNNFYMSQPA